MRKKNLTEEIVKAKVLYFIILITSSIKTPRSESVWAVSAITEFLERQAYNEGLEE